MSKAEAAVEELVGMIERGELRLPEMQRRYVWRSTRVRDLFDALYRGYPSGAILLWEADGPVPLQAFAVEQQGNPYSSTRLLLDGQQRLTSLSAVIRGASVSVRGRKRPIDLLFNLEHPDQLNVVTEVRLGLAGQCQGTLFARLQRDAAGPGHRHAARRRRCRRVAGAIAYASRPARRTA